MKSVARILLALLILLPIVSAGIGWYAGPSALHPTRRLLDASDLTAADAEFSRVGEFRNSVLALFARAGASENKNQ